MVSANYRVLICCTYHFQSSSLFFVYFGFLCLHVSPVSHFCPDTRGRKLSLIKSHLFSCVVGRQEHCKQYHWHLLGVLRVYGPHWVCPSSWHMCFIGLHCSGSRLLCRGTVKSGSGFHELPRYKLLRFRFSYTPQNTDSVGPAFWARPRSEQLRRPGAW